MTRRNIFRPSALERLASPERLDQLPGVTARRLGLVVLAGGVCLLTMALWWLVDVALRT